MSDFDGVPPGMVRTLLYGHGSDGRKIAAASDRHMRVRDKNGRGYSSAHGSLGGNARDEAADALESAGLTRLEREAMALEIAGIDRAAISLRLGITLTAVRGRLARAWRRVHEHGEMLASMGRPRRE